MKCLACDVILSDREATRKFVDSGKFVDLCSECIQELPDDLRTYDNLSLNDDPTEENT